jgi:hypothetical protein
VSFPGKNALGAKELDALLTALRDPQYLKPDGTLNSRAIERATGIDQRTVRRHIAKLGLNGTQPVLDGYYLSKSTAVIGKNGELEREFIQQKPEHGGPFEVPEGHNVKGISALVDADGRVVNQWVKTSAGQRSPEEIAEAFEVAFRDFKPAAPYVIPPKDSDSDRLTVYPVADWHLGMFAWGKETDGPDWDLSIARKVLTETFLEVLHQSPPSENAVLLGLGDLLHGDNRTNTTPQHKNPLDVDTRHSKCVETACDIMGDISEAVSRKHHNVQIVFKEGNHDQDSTVGLRMALRGWWRNEDRIRVDTSPSPFWFNRFGINLLGGVHGDKAKMKELPLLMAVMRKEDWAASTTHHWHTGHFHSEKALEVNGVVCHQHRAPIPPESFHNAFGYRSGRSMRAFNYHADRGFRGLNEVEIQ